MSHDGTMAVGVSSGDHLSCASFAASVVHEYVEEIIKLYKISCLNFLTNSCGGSYFRFVDVDLC